MKNHFAALLLALVPAARAAEGALPAFEFKSAAGLRADKIVLVAPEPRPADVITRSHMHAQAGKTSLFGYADTRAQFEEAVAHWSEVLRAAGIEPGTPNYNEGFFVLPYRAPAGLVIRDFMAEPRQFPPKDEAGLRANMALAQDALTRAGLTPISARVLNLDALLPTYSILYLAKAEAKPEHETRLRVLKPGDDIDMDMIRLSGVTMVQTPTSWMLVYIGPELGFVGMAARTMEEAELKLAKRTKFLVDAGKRIIGSKIGPMGDPEWRFAVDLYFFQ